MEIFEQRLFDLEHIIDLHKMRDMTLTKDEKESSKTRALIYISERSFCLNYNLLKIFNPNSPVLDKFKAFYDNIFINDKFEYKLNDFPGKNQVGN